jgi:hypothetical protein
MVCFLKRTCRRLQFIVCAFKSPSYLGCPLRIGAWNMLQVQIGNRTLKTEKKERIGQIPFFTSSARRVLRLDQRSETPFRLNHVRSTPLSSLLVAKGFTRFSSPKTGGTQFASIQREAQNTLHRCLPSGTSVSNNPYGRSCRHRTLEGYGEILCQFQRTRSKDRTNSSRLWWKDSRTAEYSLHVLCPIAKGKVIR